MKNYLLTGLLALFVIALFSCQKNEAIAITPTETKELSNIEVRDGFQQIFNGRIVEVSAIKE